MWLASDGFSKLLLAFFKNLTLFRVEAIRKKISDYCVFVSASDIGR